MEWFSNTKKCSLKDASFEVIIFGRDILNLDYTNKLMQASTDGPDFYWDLLYVCLEEWNNFPAALMKHVPQEQKLVESDNRSFFNREYKHSRFSRNCWKINSSKNKGWRNLRNLVKEEDKTNKMNKRKTRRQTQKTCTNIQIPTVTRQNMHNLHTINTYTHIHLERYAYKYLQIDKHINIHKGLFI